MLARALAVFVVVGSSQLALADHGVQAKCFVKMIQATHEGGGLDPKITRLAPYLQKEPFTSWKKFALVDEKDLTLLHSATETFKLPNGKQASLTFVDHMMTAEKKHRMRLRLEIEDGPRKLLNTTFVLDEGGVVLQAGQKLGNGLLILGFSCDMPSG